MSDKEPPETLTDGQIEDVQGGGLMDTKAGTFGYEAVTMERGVKNGVKAPYIGETEKNVWKAPAGVTHDEQFEQ